MEQNDSIVVAVGGDFTTEVVDEQGMLAKRFPASAALPTLTAGIMRVAKQAVISVRLLGWVSAARLFATLSLFSWALLPFQPTVLYKRQYVV